ncbi:MAG: ABC transporter ATP-binding protein [Actinomycetes bacterium]
MAKEQDDVEVLEDVEWLVDEDGTEFFVEDGVRYELGEDGYAYPVEEGVQVVVEEPAARESEPPAPPADATRQIPRVTTSARTSPGGLAVTPSSGAPNGAATGAAPAATAALRPASGEALLEVQQLRSGYGSLPVLHGVDMAIRPGETAVMLGLNGAGKTTTALNICGALGATGGRILFDGKDITDFNLRKAVDAGIVMVPEGRRVFPDLPVRRNLQIGAWSHRSESDLVEQMREKVYDYFPRLRERADQLAGTLSGGEQQMLAIGRGLMARPRLLIIDEASMGLAPVIVKDVFDIVSQINDDGTTVLMIEQNVGALDVADVGYVMEQGRMVRELRGDDLRDRSKVTEILMG